MDAGGAGTVPVAPEGTYKSQAARPTATTMHVARTYRREAFRYEIPLPYVVRNRFATSRPVPVGITWAGLSTESSP